MTFEITGGVAFRCDFFDRPLNDVVDALVFGILLMAPVLGGTGVPEKLALGLGGEHPI